MPDAFGNLLGIEDFTHGLRIRLVSHRDPDWGDRYVPVPATPDLRSGDAGRARVRTGRGSAVAAARQKLPRSGRGARSAGASEPVWLMLDRGVRAADGGGRHALAHGSIAPCAGWQRRPDSAGHAVRQEGHSKGDPVAIFRRGRVGGGRARLHAPLSNRPGGLHHAGGSAGNLDPIAQGAKPRFPALRKPRVRRARPRRNHDTYTCLSSRHGGTRCALKPGPRVARRSGIRLVGAGVPLRPFFTWGGGGTMEALGGQVRTCPRPDRLCPFGVEGGQSDTQSPHRRRLRCLRSRSLFSQSSIRQPPNKARFGLWRGLPVARLQPVTRRSGGGFAGFCSWAKRQLPVAS